MESYLHKQQLTDVTLIAGECIELCFNNNAPVGVSIKIVMIQMMMVNQMFKYFNKQELLIYPNIFMYIKFIKIYFYV